MSVRWERFKVGGEELVARVKALIHDGNVRRIRVKQGTVTLAEFPLTVGVVGALGAPALAALGALAALLTRCSIEVERVEAASASRAPRPAAGGRAKPRRSAARPRSRS